MSDAPPAATTPRCTRWRSSAATSTSARTSSSASATRSAGPSARTHRLVHALLRHFEAVGFDGAPRALGLDERGREVLSYVEGEAALAPIPRGDDVVAALGRLLRRMHDAQAGFVPPPDWHEEPLRPPPGVTTGSDDVVCHNDLFPPNVVFRQGLPVALDRLGLRVPAPRAVRRRLGGQLLGSLYARTPRLGRGALDRPPRGERLRLLCDGYGLDAAARLALLDVVAHRNVLGYEIHRVRGGLSACPAGARCGTRAAGTRSSTGARGSRRIAPTCDDPSREPPADHRRRHRLGRPGHSGAAARPARERRARGAARRHRHVRALRRPAPLRRLPPRPGGLRSRASPTRSARSSSGKAPTASCPSRRSTSRGWPSIATPSRCPCSSRSPDAIFRSNDKAETYAFLHRLGLPAPAFRRVNGAARGGGGGTRARLPRRARLLQAGVLLRVARLPDPRPDGRPRAPAAERAARLGRDAPRGGGRAAPRRGWAGPARDGARDRRRAHDRRHRRRRAHPARAPEDARGDARRPRDVLRHARGRGADGRSPTGSWPSSRSSTSSTSSSSAST